MLEVFIHMDQGTSSLLIFGLMIVVFYFFLIRPQKKREKADSQMRNSIQIGDEIITIGGMSGKVVSVKDDSIVFETGADRVKIKLCKWAVRSRESTRAVIEE